MTELQFWQTFWFIAIGAAFFIFTWLDGFDLGIGMLLPFQKTDRQKTTLLNVIWPFWDGNELYGLIGGGAIFAAFPMVFAGLLSGLYPWITLVLVFIMLRPVVLEAWLHDRKWRKYWEILFCVSSFMIPFITGVAIGGTISGLPYQANGYWDPSHSFLEVLSPLSVLTGMTMVALCLLHGNAYLIKKTQEELVQQAYKKLPLLTLSVTILIFAISVLIFTGSTHLLERPWAFFGIPSALLLIILGLVGLFHRFNKTKEFLPFLSSSLVIAGIWLFVGSVQFPFMIRSSINPEFSMNIFNPDVSNPLNSLQFIGILATIGLLIVFAYSMLVYRIFKGKVHANSYIQHY